MTLPHDSLTVINRDATLRQQADDRIHQLRSEAYFVRWDHFAATWLAPLEVTAETILHTGAILGVGVDSLFESIQADQLLPELISQLDRIAVPANARQFLSDISADGPLTLLEAAQIEYAWVTLAGYVALRNHDLELVNVWLQLWQAALHAQNQEQAKHRRHELEAEAYPETFSGSFDEAVQHYIQDYQSTSTLLITFLAAFPFSPRLDAQILQVGAQNLQPLLALYRLIEDALLDNSEALNAGVYATSQMLHVNLKEARQRLLTEPELAKSVQKDLLDQAFHVVAEMKRQHPSATVDEQSSKQIPQRIMHLLIDYAGEYLSWAAQQVSG